MAVYCLGFAIPFLFMSMFIDKLTFFKRNSDTLMKAGGVIMILMGIILYFNWLIKFISIITNNFFGGFTGF
ncbi:cytochrome c biogenesis protein CcdA [Cytobacillus oceanisediminis]|nr:cytochrome c biogenesis protein CcdA [Cytobacillus oceanisediminis]